MINRLFKLLSSEVNSLLDVWEKDLRQRKKEKNTSEKTYTYKKDNFNSDYTRKELQAFSDLELTPTKNREQIKKQFKTQIKKYHPDKYQDPIKKKTANIITKRLNAAYTLLYKNKE